MIPAGLSHRFLPLATHPFIHGLSGNYHITIASVKKYELVKFSYVILTFIIYYPYLYSVNRDTFKIPIMRKSVRFFLDRKTAKRPVPLFMYFSFGYKEIHDGKTKYIPLKYSTGHVVHPNKWDAENQKVKNSHQDADDINNTLAEMKVEAIRTHNSLRDRKRTNQEI